MARLIAEAEMYLRFEWDPEKAEKNYRKHKVTFEDVSGIFHDPHSMTLFDAEHSDSEERWITIGRVGSALFVVVHTFDETARNISVRIISARRATRREKIAYED